MVPLAALCSAVAMVSVLHLSTGQSPTALHAPVRTAAKPVVRGMAVSSGLSARVMDGRHAALVSTAPSATGVPIRMAVQTHAPRARLAALLALPASVAAMFYALGRYTTGTQKTASVDPKAYGGAAQAMASVHDRWLDATAVIMGRSPTRASRVPCSAHPATTAIVALSYSAQEEEQLEFRTCLGPSRKLWDKDPEKAMLQVERCAELRYTRLYFDIRDFSRELRDSETARRQDPTEQQRRLMRRAELPGQNRRDIGLEEEKKIERLQRLIELELEEDTRVAEDRLEPDQRIEENGHVLFKLKVYSIEPFYEDFQVTLGHADNSPLPCHSFGVGDLITVSRVHPQDGEALSGQVLRHTPTSITVAMQSAPPCLTNGVWCVDLISSEATFLAMKRALKRLPKAYLRPLLLSGTDTCTAESPSTPLELAQAPSPFSPTLRASALITSGLNPSQVAAVTECMDHTLSLIQGPPGTGKTKTAAHILHSWVHAGYSSSILATAGSNAGVDNLLEGIAARGIRAVRVGSPVKVAPHLRRLTLAAQMQDHPEYPRLAALQERVRSLYEYSRSVHPPRSAYNGDVARLQTWVNDLRTRMQLSILRRAEVVCATCIAASGGASRRMRYKFVLVDEATQTTEPAVLVPLVQGARHVVLIGDPKQLPPTVVSREAQLGGLDVSLFERLAQSGVPTHMLSVQYRMHPSISKFPSHQFYNGRLLDGISAADRVPPSGFPWPVPGRPVAFVPVNRGREATSGSSESKMNAAEAQVTRRIVDMLLSGGDVAAEDIGIVTPYKQQVEALKDLFREAAAETQGLSGAGAAASAGIGAVAGARTGTGIGGNHGDQLLEVEVHSVDGYQGREKKVIVVTTVRANAEGDVGFLADYRRLNVAITRARCGLVVVGHTATLYHDPYWAAWLDCAVEEGLVLKDQSWAQCCHDR